MLEGRNPADKNFEKPEEAFKAVKSQLKQIDNGVNLPQRRGRTLKQDDAVFNILESYLRQYFELRWEKYPDIDSSPKAMADEFVVILSKNIEGTKDRKELEKFLDSLASIDQKMASLLYKGSKQVLSG